MTALTALTPGELLPAFEASTRAREVLAEPRNAWRSEPEARRQAYARRHGVGADVLDDPPQLAAELEIALGKADFLPGRWLRLGAAAAEAVARVEVPAGFGTGFLVSPWLLLTNNHVVPDVATAENAQVMFRYRNDADDQRTQSVRHTLEPRRCFVTAAVTDLDFTLVAVTSTGDGAPPGSVFGWLPAIGAQGKILEGRPVNIVGHPQGRPREISVRSNLLLAVESTTRLTYQADTDRGSSGSPVLNDEWELVALHQRGGGLIDGRPVGNEGIRISAIVEKVRTIARAVPKTAGVDANALLTEFLDIGWTR
ncbi:serine protease [Parafrankia sp. EUN1f]|uniref:trypsin-like serine peptidase n=1 Tax=Parafrankia sp. EUN1f TaxID=102897 RepID=UPI0001C4396F|nr:serine protease [Parafrankia sp. EUN1f]EFC85918.1 DNA/RNA non-specific endonuclease [Parafrankia sp. EUN1f]